MDYDVWCGVLAAEYTTQPCSNKYHNKTYDKCHTRLKYCQTGCRSKYYMPVVTTSPKIFMINSLIMSGSER